VTAAIIDTATLAKVVVYSLLAGVGISVLFAVGVSSAASVADALRDRRTAAGAAWVVVFVLSAVVVLGIVVLGIVVMSTK